MRTNDRGRGSCGLALPTAVLPMAVVVALTLASTGCGGRPASNGASTSGDARSLDAGSRDSKSAPKSASSFDGATERTGVKSESDAAPGPNGRSGGEAGANQRAAPVKVVDRSKLNELVNAAKGRPLTVVYWAPWVAHQDILPNILANLRKKRPDLRVYLVLLAPLDSRQQVEAGSGVFKADEVCVHYCREIDEALAAFELDADGLPAVRVHDRDGRVLSSFGVEADAAEDLQRIIEQRVAAALERLPRDG